MPLNMEKLREFADLYLQRQHHQKKEKELTEKISKMEQALMDHMVAEGTDKVHLTDGTGRTISINQQIWPKYGHKSIAIEALKDAGIKDLIEEGFNHNRLASYIRELLKSDKDLPKEFSGKIKAETVSKLVARKL